MKYIDGGVCAPMGFKANGIHAGIRENKSKIDLALVLSDVECNAAAVYTTNLVKGAPVYVTKANLNNGKARAIICNSGNANTCNADGIEIATKTCEILANVANINAEDVIIASTGVIGLSLSIKPFKDNMQKIYDGLAQDAAHADLALAGIMTTDTVKKSLAVEFMLDGKVCKIGAMTKGSGMISPNMATMLCFITTDANISSVMLDKALHDVIDDSFNMLSVDGDTSTNDTVAIMASGLAGNKLIDSYNADYEAFKEALATVCLNLAIRMAKDGEGASRLVICEVANAKTIKDARLAAKSVVSSSLVKAAMFGADANFGRISCAVGYSRADVDVQKMDISYKSKKGKIDVCKNGCAIPFSEEIAKEILLDDEITIEINLNDGKSFATAYGCDLTYDYVKINGDYRS